MPETTPPEPIPADLEPTAPGRRRPLRAVLAGAVALVLVGATVAVVATRGGSGRPALRLSRSAGGSEASADGKVAAASDLMLARPVHYVLEGELPDLGPTAPVYRIAGPAVDEARARRLADALDMKDAKITANTDGVGGFQAQSADALLVLGTFGGVTTLLYQSQSGGWAISGSSGGGSTGSDPGIVPPDATQAGGGVSACPTTTTALPLNDSRAIQCDVPTTAADQPNTDIAKPGAPVPLDDTPPPTIKDPQIPMTPPLEPAPDAAEAKKIAIGVLARLGVYEDAKDWRVEVLDGGVTGVAYSCAQGADCPAPPPDVVTARTVSFARVVDGVTAHGLDWTVDVGAHGVITSVSGTLGTPEKIGEYPLRTTRAAFDALVKGDAMLTGPQPLSRSAVPDVGALEKGAPTPVAESSDAAVSEPSTGAATEPGTKPIEPIAPGVGAPDPSTVEIMPEPLPEPPVPPEPVTVTVTVTGVKLGLASWPGSADGKDVTYLVPTYRFATRDDAGTVGEVEVLALTDDALTSETTAPPTDPVPATPPPTTAATSETTVAPPVVTPTTALATGAGELIVEVQVRAGASASPLVVEYTVDDVSVGSSPLDTGAGINIKVTPGAHVLTATVTPTGATPVSARTDFDISGGGHVWMTFTYAADQANLAMTPGK